jgi:heme-degrading monooxygenase HmoA
LPAVVWDVLIISGYLVISPTDRNAYVEECVAVVEAALAAPGCLDFSVTADSRDPSRVRVYERWESEPQLLAFRGSGPSNGQEAAIVAAEVRRYGVSSVGDA